MGAKRPGSTGETTRLNLRGETTRGEKLGGGGGGGGWGRNVLLSVAERTAFLVVSPIKVNSFAYLFDCTAVGRAFD